MMIAYIVNFRAFAAAGLSLCIALTGCGRQDYAALDSGEALPSAPMAVAKGRVDIEGGVIQIAAARDGVISEVLVEEGDRVQKGQVLARQDASVAMLGLLEAKAAIGTARERMRLSLTQLDAARREHLRVVALVQTGVESLRARDEAGDRERQLEVEVRLACAEVKAASVRIDVARLELKQREIRAPIDGIIVRRSARPGSGASTLNVTSLFTLAPDTPKIVRAELEESFISAIQLGQRVEVVGETNPLHGTTGKVIRIAHVFGAKRPSDDPNEKTDERVVEVVTSLDNPSFLIGQRVRVNFKDAS